MQSNKIRVGVVGANPDRGWGSAVHLPVIAALDEFVLEAVCTTRKESAEESARRYGARLAFTDPLEMAAHPDVDLIAVTVKAPEHHRLTMLALEAGKHVYCEWPLAVTVAQAREMRDLAAKKNLKAMVGLQSRAAPALMRAHDLVRDGYVGRVTAVRMSCAIPSGGGRQITDGIYVIDKANGANNLTIHGGHGIDALRFVAGEFADFSAIVATEYKEVVVVETGEKRVKDAPDQVLVSGTLQNGAVVSACISGGVVAGHGVELKIFGSEGTISVSWQSPLGFMMSDLLLEGARTPERKLAVLEIPEGYGQTLLPPGFTGRPPYPGAQVPTANWLNVANLYRRLGNAILHDAPLTPDFAVATQMHELLEAMETASATGQRQSLTAQ